MHFAVSLLNPLKISNAKVAVSGMVALFLPCHQSGKWHWLQLDTGPLGKLTIATFVYMQSKMFILDFKLDFEVILVYFLNEWVGGDVSFAVLECLFLAIAAKRIWVTATRTHLTPYRLKQIKVEK